MVTIEKLIGVAEHYKKLFSLQSWRIHCYILPLSEMPADGAWGHIIVEHEYMRARLSVAAETPDDQLPKVVCHEVSHVVVGMITHVMSGLIDELPSNRKNRERKLLSDANEMATELIARTVMRLDIKYS